MDHNERLVALDRIGKRRVRYQFFEALYRAGHDILPYQSYARIISPGFEVSDFIRDRPTIF